MNAKTICSSASSPAQSKNINPKINTTPPDIPMVAKGMLINFEAWNTDHIGTKSKLSTP